MATKQGSVKGISTPQQALQGQALKAYKALTAGWGDAIQAQGARYRQEQLDCLAQRPEHVTRGILSSLLGMVFVVYCERHGHLPLGNPAYRSQLSLTQLASDLAAKPGRPVGFDAWQRVRKAFTALHQGVRVAGEGADFAMPARGGRFFDAAQYPFLSSRLGQPFSDQTLARVLQYLLADGGRTVQYEALDAHCLGNLYESLMGFTVRRLDGPAVCLRQTNVWVTGEELLAVEPDSRQSLLRRECKIKIKDEPFWTDLRAASAASNLLQLMQRFAQKGVSGQAGDAVLQPNQERRTSGSHYTPKNIAEEVVNKAIEPLIKALGPNPSSKDLLNLKICDMAQGCGAFLLVTCEQMADKIVEAWQQEGAIDSIQQKHADVLAYARRLAAQRCIYGVDRNDMAIEVAKLSLWLLSDKADDVGFGFLDKKMRFGDALIGLTLDQIKAFSWEQNAKPIPELVEFVDKCMQQHLAKSQA